jgi:D-amino-acid oxidase
MKSSRERHALVLGAGAIGLTSALTLRRRDWAVTVVADRFAPHITSAVAGALWEWPPGVCGKHVNLESARGWAKSSLYHFTELANDPTTGVFVRPVTFYFQHDLAGDAFQQEKMAQLAEVARGFRHDAALIREHGIGPRHVYRDAYQHLAPMIDTDTYLIWLMDRVREAGCDVREKTITAPLHESTENLLKEFGADVIVNCTGFGSRELAADSGMYPLRGAVIRIRNDGRTMPRIEQAHCVSHDGINPDPGFVFIVPRGADKLLLGGFAEPHESSLDIGLADYEPIQEMFHRCVEFLPSLKNAEIEAAEPLRVGLRPARERGVRLEWDDTLPIVHNYGHGGSGLTYSWGCAEEVASLLNEPR